MTPAQAGKAIDKILKQDITKTAKAMLLYELGLTRTEAAELVPMNYSQAHTAWTRYYDGSEPPRVPQPAGVRELRQEHDGHRKRPRSDGRALFLTPSQTRFITQDGHEIIRIDRDSGAECQECRKRVQFSLKWLGFVHSGSHTEPTNLEDRYND